MTEGLKGIIAQLEHQKAAIERALAALREVEGIEAPASQSSVAPERRGGMTPEGRQRLAEAMKRRWGIKRAASAVKKTARRKRATEKAA